MSTVNELKYADLLIATSLSVPVTLSELEHYWLETTRSHTGTVSEMWYQEFVANGGSAGKSWNENAYLYLVAAGATEASLSEMWYEFWTDDLLPGSTFTWLDADDTPYVSPLTFLDADDTSYIIPKTWLDADDTSYSL